tara:strand:- start:209 stop:523 length:315 start_codon:yes stop_codon:yes gene_type:complete
MIDFKTFIEESEMELLDEAGNVSSGLAIRKHNQVLKYGKEIVRYEKEIIRANSVEEKLDLMAKQNGIEARQNASLGGLVLMSVTVSGDKSFGSSITRTLSLRNL